MDEVESQVKKQEAFEKLISSQDERLDQLFQTGDKLISQNHFERAQIASRLADIQTKRLKVKQLCVERRRQLEDALLHAIFKRDVADAKSWIAEKQKKLDSEIKVGEIIVSLEDKIKKLQKHQAFQAEIAANEGRIHEIKIKGETLIAKKHKAYREIKKEVAELEALWKNLAYEIDLRGRGLEEAHDILEFNNVLDKLEAWIRDKEVMIQAGDVGRDYEHCQALQRKLDDVDSDMRVDDNRVKNMNILADKLVSQGQPGVQNRREAFLKKWQQLQGALEQYRAKLFGASEIHLFDRDIDDTSQRIIEKTVAMETDDLGKSVDDVQALQRKQETLEHEINAVESKLKDHDRDSRKLITKYPNSNAHIQSKIDDLHKQYATLLHVRDKRRTELGEAFTHQKFLAELKDLELWVADTIKRMNSYQKPTNDSEAEAQLGLHDELKAEIDGRQPAFKNLISFGQKLAETKSPDYTNCVKKLEDLQKSVIKAWEKCKKDLTHEYLVQGFKEQADQLETWLVSKEAFLNNDDIGDNLRAVDALIRKHQDFEVMLNQQLSRVDDLQNIAEGILTQTQYDNSEVSNRLKTILARKQKLLDKCKNHINVLLDSKALHVFIRNIHEVENWLTHKLQIAGDENYREPSNLQSKIQKHTAFDAEITHHGGRIHDVIEEGNGLIGKGHFASKEILGRITDLENDWKHLQELSDMKRDRLKEAYEALLFNRTLDEFEVWLLEVEQQVQSSDYGKDLATANHLLKRHITLENDVHQHAENCEAINEMAEQFLNNDHFMCDELQERANNALAKYHQLLEPMQTRRDNLEASSMLHQFTRDVDDELQWLADREPLANSDDLGTSLTSVQNLLKKHQALETELISREPIVGSLIARAAHLKRIEHYAAHIIEDKAIEVKSKLSQIRDMASLRKLRLQDAYEAQLVSIIFDSYIFIGF